MPWCIINGSYTLGFCVCVCVCPQCVNCVKMCVYYEEFECENRYINFYQIGIFAIKAAETEENDKKIWYFSSYLQNIPCYVTSEVSLIFFFCSIWWWIYFENFEIDVYRVFTFKPFICMRVCIPVAAISCSEWGGRNRPKFIWPLFWWAKAGNSSVASFLVWGGGQAPKCTDIKKNHIHVTYMHERAKRASASETYIGLYFSYGMAL